jgi:hypothetical protein
MKFKELLTKKYADLPLWAWLLVGTVGVGTGIYLLRRAKAGSTKPADAIANPSTGDSTAIIPSGNPGYGDYSAVGSSAGQAAPGATVINIGQPASNPSNWLTTLILTNNGPVPMYDSAGTPGGTDLGNQLATIPGGSQIQATGPELVGAWLRNNLSELWYPVVYNGQSGFINAYYVANASSGIQNNPIPPIPTQPPKTYTITSDDMKQRDPLHSIAAKFMITYDQLYAANKSLLGSDKNHAKFKAGDTLTIPQKGVA